MAEKQLVIAFDEGEVAPTGSYPFELDLSGQSGCDIIEQIVWMIETRNPRISDPSIAEVTDGSDLGAV